MKSPKTKNMNKRLVIKDSGFRGFKLAMSPLKLDTKLCACAYVGISLGRSFGFWNPSLTIHSKCMSDLWASATL